MKEKKASILVVDDEESLRMTFSRFLSNEGYAVMTAQSYEEAASLIAEQDFDMIFADIVLPGRPGTEVLREVKERKLLCPVVMITGNPRLESAAEAVRLGAFDYISKPVNKDTLLNLVSLVLKYRQVVEEREQNRLYLEAIFRSVKDAIITVDKDLTIIAMNKAAEDICCFSRDSIGKSFPSPKTDCEGECTRFIQQTITTKAPVEKNHICCHYRGGLTRSMSLVTYPLIDARENFSGVVLVLRDETRLVELERNLEDRRQYGNIIGKNYVMQKVYGLIDDLADVDTTVLIKGESGTGKELVAEAIHYKGLRRDMPLIKVNCSALSENLLESELFGHVKGAFTGAYRDKKGRFELAQGGSIFLDEIGELSPRVQLRLLRVLQEKEFERVGGSNTIRADVRVIAATNRDLKKKIQQGEFREDLYYRLHVVEITLPPLRERSDDIRLLADHFLHKLNKNLGKDIKGISEDVIALFMKYSWPGNVRELEHAIEHALIICRGPIITTEHLPPDIQKSPAVQQNDASEQSGITERERFIEALKKTDWNKAKAARVLGVSRRTIYRKLQDYGIEDNCS